MAEYIEREALLLRIDCHGTNKFGMLDEDIRAFIKAQPAADVAEVVRCKDCNGSQVSDDGKYIICCRLGVRTGFWDFCSCGERKDADT